MESSYLKSTHHGTVKKTNKLEKTKSVGYGDLPDYLVHIPTQAWDKPVIKADEIDGDGLGAISGVAFIPALSEGRSNRVQFRSPERPARCRTRRQEMSGMRTFFSFDFTGVPSTTCSF